MKLKNKKTLQILYLSSYNHSLMQFFFNRANIDDITFDFITILPKLDFKGKYNLKVKVSIFDLSGQGDVRGAFCK